MVILRVFQGRFQSAMTLYNIQGCVWADALDQSDAHEIGLLHCNKTRHAANNEVWSVPAHLRQLEQLCGSLFDSHFQSRPNCDHWKVNVCFWKDGVVLKVSAYFSILLRFQQTRWWFVKLRLKIEISPAHCFNRKKKNPLRDSGMRRVWRTEKDSGEIKPRE